MSGGVFEQGAAIFFQTVRKRNKFLKNYFYLSHNLHTFKADFQKRGDLYVLSNGFPMTLWVNKAFAIIRVQPKA